MKILNLSQSLILATTIFLVFVVPLRAQATPQDFLKAHNQVRATVGVGPLTWDEKVAAFARNNLNQRKGDCGMRRSGGPYGENMASGSQSLPASEVVNMWVGEKSAYNYNSNTCAPGKVCGDYTQVVWKKSVRLGCANVKCNNGQTLVTCNYDPPGNVAGQKPY